MRTLRESRRRALTLLRERGPQSVGRALRLTTAATVAYGVALGGLTDRHPVTASLTALLIVQVTLVGTVADTARRILSVVAGVGVAIAISAFVGLHWWSLGIVVAAALLVGQLLRLGPHLLEVPISAMIVMAAGGFGVQAEDRVLETVIGAGIGLLINLVVPPSTRTRTAGSAVESYGRDVATVLERAADLVDAGPVSADAALRRLDDLRGIVARSVDIDRLITEAGESRRLNPRAVGTLDPVPDLRGGMNALEHASVALRAVVRSLAEGVADPMESQTDDAALRHATATLLRDLGRTFAAFGALVRSGAERDDEPAAELAAALDASRRTRADLSQLLGAEASRGGDWVVRGFMLHGVERVISELDLDQFAARREQHRQQVRRSSQAAQRLRSSTRRAVDDGVRKVVLDAGLLRPPRPDDDEPGRSGVI